MAIILNYNSADDTMKCVRYLKKQKHVDLIITVIDNASTDNSRSVLELDSKENNYILISNKSNNGFSAGNNIGLKFAVKEQCEYAMIINPDVEIRDDDYIYLAVNKMNEDSEIAVLGTDIINANKQHQNPMVEISFLKEVFLFLEIIDNKIKKGIPNIGDHTKSGYCQKISGCCFFVRMKFIEKVGFLDEGVFMYCEEPILAKMVEAENKKLFYLKELVAYHQHFSSQKGDSAARFERFYKSRVYYLENYSGYTGLKLKVAKISRKIQKNIYISKSKKRKLKDEKHL